MNFTVLLTNGFTGTIDSDSIDGQDATAFIGEMVNVHAFDVNGNSVNIEGVLAEVLESSNF